MSHHVKCECREPVAVEVERQYSPQTFSANGTRGAALLEQQVGRGKNLLLAERVTARAYRRWMAEARICVALVFGSNSAVARHYEEFDSGTRKQRLARRHLTDALLALEGIIPMAVYGWGSFEPSPTQPRNGAERERAARSIAAPARIFISHSSEDRAIAYALVALLRMALPLNAADIRCSSVDGHLLAGGVDIVQSLRQEVSECELLLALVSDNSLASSYVAFELGARWHAGRPLIPLVARPLVRSESAGPLHTYHWLRLDTEAQIHQLIIETAQHLRCKAESAAVYGKTLLELKWAIGPSDDEPTR